MFTYHCSLSIISQVIDGKDQIDDNSIYRMHTTIKTDQETKA